jgi:hypothetical protein
MANSKDASFIASKLKDNVEESSSGSKRLKLRNLLSKFGYKRRSDTNTAQITQILSDTGLTLNPPIVRFGEEWGIEYNDWVYLSVDVPQEPEAPSPLPTWNADGWFDRIAKLNLRTEKEVETKFIIPLLTRLGYIEDDRYDAMPVPAAIGSRKTTLVIDFALFNSALPELHKQPLLTVEAKREGRLTKKKELEAAHNQAKSYCLWAQCDYFMITDSRTVQTFHIARGGGLSGLEPLFSCERSELVDCFGELYARISKEALTKHYMAKLSTTEEAT